MATKKASFASFPPRPRFLLKVPRARRRHAASTFAPTGPSTIASKQYAARPRPAPAPPAISACSTGAGSANEPSAFCFDATKAAAAATTASSNDADATPSAGTRCGREDAEHERGEPQRAARGGAGFTERAERAVSVAVGELPLVAGEDVISGARLHVARQSPDGGEVLDRRDVGRGVIMFCSPHPKARARAVPDRRCCCPSRRRSRDPRFDRVGDDQRRVGRGRSTRTRSRRRRARRDATRHRVDRPGDREPSGTTRMVFCTASETPASSVVATNVTGTSPSDVGVNAANVALAKEPARTVTVAGDPTGVDPAASQSFSAVLIWIVAVTS